LAKKRKTFSLPSNGKKPKGGEENQEGGERKGNTSFKISKKGCWLRRKGGEGVLKKKGGEVIKGVLWLLRAKRGIRKEKEALKERGGPNLLYNKGGKGSSCQKKLFWGKGLWKKRIPKKLRSAPIREGDPNSGLMKGGAPPAIRQGERGA